ncbi:ATP-binding protein [Nocardioides sp. YIM 152315]|uniref:ATP-binding protein n=1 Tax=Nocardioides sp. YIM 152315 TaxID=3031760 RepID=UPI0023DB3483|nr:ATP-binding protein [Nocardioides sp. YIM 152315]MDF1603214.1 ATP-binding protein [Nocardioides sp. YIM 152315]
MPPKPIGVEELRSLFLFQQLSDAQLDSLNECGWVEGYEPGVVFSEGQEADRFYVLLEGTISLSRRVGADEVEITRTDERGCYAGAWSAARPDDASERHQVTLRAVTAARFFTVDARDFAGLIADWFPMALHLLDGVFRGNRTAQRLVGEREHLLALGSLSAGLAHELNNPASAAGRASATLRAHAADARQALGLLAARAGGREHLETLVNLLDRTVERLGTTDDHTPLEASDREDDVVGWLDDHAVDDAYDLAPTLVQAGLDRHWLGEVHSVVGQDLLDPAMRWLTHTLEAELLTREIEDSTTRLSALVSAVRHYSQMDRAPQQVLDVHELLDSTLTMLGGKLAGVRVVREYDRSLAPIPVYGAELNQVWTNLVDNAVQAMRGSGTLTLRTSRFGEFVQIEVADTGPGIPPDVIGRIFEPFFTTKPVGQGTGLGLDISWRIIVNRHHGVFSVTSVPGDTRFQVRLHSRGPAAAPA